MFRSRGTGGRLLVAEVRVQRPSFTGWERLAPAETLRRAWGRGGSVQPGGRSGPYQSRGIGTSSRWILAVP